VNGRKGFSTPPEGVLAGESVPVENEQDSIDESEIEQLANEIGLAWPQLSESERRDRARRLLGK
jgi:hypothetical protein